MIKTKHKPKIVTFAWIKKKQFYFESIKMHCIPIFLADGIVRYDFNVPATLFQLALTWLRLVFAGDNLLVASIGLLLSLFFTEWASFKPVEFATAESHCFELGLRWLIGIAPIEIFLLFILVSFFVLIFVRLLYFASHTSPIQFQVTVYLSNRDFNVGKFTFKI